MTDIYMSYDNLKRTGQLRNVRVESGFGTVWVIFCLMFNCWLSSLIVTVSAIQPHVIIGSWLENNRWHSDWEKILNAFQISACCCSGGRGEWPDPDGVLGRGDEEGVRPVLQGWHKQWRKRLKMLFQVWETPLLPRQVLDKLEIKGFKVSLNLKMAQSWFRILKSLVFLMLKQLSVGWICSDKLLLKMLNVLLFLMLFRQLFKVMQ